MNDPIELLTNKNDRQVSFLNDKWNPFMGAIFGFGAAAFVNWGTRRPAMSGIQKHIAFSALGYIIGKYFDVKQDEYTAKRDAVLRHYVELHPEDFPPKERKKYGEILEEWVPIR